MDAASYRAKVNGDGFCVVEGVLDRHDVEELRSAIDSLLATDSGRSKGNPYGIRSLLEQAPIIEALARDARIRQFVTPVLGSAAFAMRATFFDKVANANWAVGWHQDRVIPVKNRQDSSGFSGWGRKAGVWHVEPPADVLANLLAVRVHLDDCLAGNGPLRVIPGSHRHGVFNDLERQNYRGPETVCEVRAGGLVIMRPLILHASSKAEVPGHRRVIHLEFAHSDLPNGLEWNSRVGG